jgi:hypothetical protein
MKKTIESTFVVSNEFNMLLDIWRCRNTWINNPKKRNIAMQMFNDFDGMTYTQYWLTDEEELFIDKAMDTLESY